LQRIEHTRENLLRVADIRDELTKQVQRLERQAKTAERYTLLKAEEQQRRAEIQALKWKDLVDQQQTQQIKMQDLLLNLEHQHSLLSKKNTERIILKEQLQQANDNAQDTQAKLYQLGTEIARIEETIAQQEREKKRLEHDKQQIQHDWQAVDRQLKQDRQDLEDSLIMLASLEGQLQTGTDAFKEKQVQWQETQLHQQNIDLRWQEAQTSTNNIKRELQLKQLNMQHLEQRQQEAVLKLEKIAMELSSITWTDLEKAKHDLEDKQIQLQEEHNLAELQLNKAQKDAQQLRVSKEQAEQQLYQLQDAFHKQNSEYAALLAAQKAARLGNDLSKEGIKEWIDIPKLMDVLQVMPQWQAVCERVLGDTLQAYVLDSFATLLPLWNDCMLQGESVVTLNKPTASKRPFATLADAIKGEVPATLPDLNSIYTAQSLEEGLAWLPQLASHESVVTPDGYWFGKGFAKCANIQGTDGSGVLSLQQKIADLAPIVQDMQDQIVSLQALRTNNHTQLQERLNAVELLQTKLSQCSEALRANNSALINNQHLLLHSQKQAQAMTAEVAVLQGQIEDVQEQIVLIKETNIHMEQQHESCIGLLELCINERASGSALLDSQSKELEELRIVMHRTELDHDRELTKSNQLKDRIQKEQERLALIEERLEQLVQLSVISCEPNEVIKQQLVELLASHAAVDAHLNLGREQMTQLKANLEDLEKRILQDELELKRMQELSTEIKMLAQELAVRASSVQETLAELDLKAELILETIAKDSTQSFCEEALIVLSQKIKNLGAINLAAIEEYTAELQRMQYLQDQYDDLQEALLTLETAIEKMDKETRLRLETTFDAVNTSFKSLFPRLFGGGRAQLELTCDNLLEAGIVVMAQPPGKRNSTIHLLSGGEKAMTAVALVFAMFQLNPSPFCLLDEVDAPLDDVNVGRFCDLVKEMSQFIQFIFITHNKVTMELADHLIGVTMREPGVSRLVTVDVKQALTTE
jgi:chromosome segregation protein